MRDRVVGYLSRPPRVKVQYRGVAQLGRAPALGAGGRWFESSHPDLRPDRVHTSTHCLD